MHSHQPCAEGVTLTIQYNTIQYNTIQYNTIQYMQIQSWHICLECVNIYLLIASIIYVAVTIYGDRRFLNVEHLRMCVHMLIIMKLLYEMHNATNRSKECSLLE